jgi:predicted SAM-dependent methyltransferase
VLEHLPFEAIPAILKDWARVLKPGGTLRLLVPDAELYVRTYMAIRGGDATRKFPYHDEASTPMMMVNRCFRSFDHLFAYDFETFERLLKNAGFNSVEQKKHKEGRDANLLIDSDERECETLRIECVKPK